MTAPDFTDPVWQARAMIPDVEKVPDPNNPYSTPEYLFTDEHIQAILDLNHGNVRLAAADLCEVLGTSEGYIAKVIKTEDLVTDGAKLMGQFIARARQLRSYAKEEMGDEGEAFEWIPYTVPPVNKGSWIGGF